MTSRFFRIIAIVLSLAVSATIQANGASAATVPAISKVKGKLVYVSVPPGFESVTLHQRTGVKAKPTKPLATREPNLAGGTITFVLKTTLAPRALCVTSVRAVPATTSSAAGTTLFPADPALGISDGFSGAGGSLSGVVAMASSVNNVTLGSTVETRAATRDVVESDIWRVAGDRLYFFNELRGLQIFDVSHPDAPALLGQLREPNHGEQMYLLDSNHVALLTRPSYFFTLNATWISLRGPSVNAGSGAVVIADVASGKPSEIARLPYPGYFVESRMVGTALYVVSDTSDGEQSGLQVTSFDLSDPTHPEQIATLFLGNYGGVVSATDRFLFVVSYSDDWRRSTIDVIDISAPNGALARRGKIKTAGIVGDKFKLSLEGDILTVVSAVARDWSGDQSNPDNASRTVIENFSLARPASPVRLGSLSVGVGETVRATRFADGRLYVVTFFTIDPLWVIDLADPKKPTLLGELEVPGFSNYIEPLGDRLVAIGRIGSQTAVSLFDVSDPANPRQLSQIPLGDGYSYSEANWDEKAFSVIPEENLILVPYSGYDRSSGWASRVQLIDLTRSELKARGFVDRPLPARRTAVVHDRILAITSSNLVTVDFDDRDHPRVTSDVEIAWRVDRVFLSGQHLVQVGGSAGWSSTEPPTLTVSTATDPDTALNVLDLENVPVVGATVRDGRLYVAQQMAGGWGPIYYLQTTTSIPTTPVNPLIVSVFDLSHLPAITRIGRTEASVDPSYGYGTAQLEAAWPDAGTLVWVRPQWMSWWWRGPIIFNDEISTIRPLVMSASSSLTLMPSGILTLSNASHITPAAETLTTSSTTTNAVTANRASLTSSTMLFAPWYRTSAGRDILVFDVRTPAAPKFTTQLTVGTGQTGDWSAPLALAGKLYFSYLAHDDVISVAAGALPRKFRHFMKRIDFADATNPAVGPEVNIPGRLLAVTRGGATLVTIGCGFDTDGKPTGKRVFHTSSFDGLTARLVDQLATPAVFDPYTLDGATLVVGSWPLGAGQIGQLQTWRVGDDEKFTLAGQIPAPVFTSLAAVRGLVVGFGNQMPHLYDVSDPANLVDLAAADARDLTDGNLTNAEGGAGQGLWLPQGAYGVGIVTLPE